MGRLEKASYLPSIPFLFMNIDKVKKVGRGISIA
jgi:hypothetical protein